MKKILISGSYGTGNVGDELILRQILNSFSGYKITVLSQGPAYTSQYFPEVQVLDQTPSWNPIRILKDLLKGRFGEIKKRISFLKALQNADIFLLGGGGLLSELVQSVLRFYIAQIHLAKIFGCKVLVFVVGVGPLRTDEGKKKLGKVLKNVELISVRDLQSKENLSKVGIDWAEVIPDPAFSLKQMSLMDNINEVGSEKVVVFNFYETFTNPEIWPNAEMKHTALIKFIHEAISKLIELGYKVTLLPFGTSGDAKFARKVHQKYKEQTNVTLFIGESYQEIMDVFKGSHFSLTMRFHAGLILFLSGVPSICIDQQFKSERFLQDVGLSEFLIRASDGIHSAEEFELDSKLLDNKISYLEENYERVRSEMASYHDKKKAEFENYIQIIKEKI